MNTKNFIRNIIIAINLLIFTSCSDKLHQYEFISMSTLVRVTVYSRQTPNWKTLENIAQRYSREYDWRSSTGLISKLNKRGKIRLTEELRKTLKTALTVAKNTAGYFDPTILALTTLWNFESGGTLPESEDITKALTMIDYNRLKITKEYAQLNNVQLDLGAIAKGAVIDHLADWLTLVDYKNFLIEAGGDILVSGLKPKEQQWKIWIKHPLKKNYPLAITELGIAEQRQAMATSGSYEQNFQEDGKIFHHIINPKTGYPAKHCISVTVIASSATEADAYATGLCVAGPEEFKLITSKENIEALMVYQTGEQFNKIATNKFPVSLQNIKL